MNPTDLRGNIRRFYVFKALEGVSFFAPIMVLFWQENGLSMTKVMLLQSFFSLVMILLDIPTGYLADVFGRRKALLCSGAFLTAAPLIYSLAHRFGTFLAAELCWGIGLSLISGADAAMLYDTLAELGEESRFSQIWGRALFYSGMSMMATQFAGGIIGAHQYRWTLYACIPFMSLVMPVALGLREPRRHMQAPGQAAGLRAALAFLVAHKKLRWLVVYAGVVFGFFNAALWLYQPYFKLTGLGVVYFGAVFAGFQGFSALVGKYAHLVEKRLGPRLSLLMLVLVTAAGYLLMANVLFRLSFCLIALHQFARGFHKVVVSDYVNKHARPDIRATILSAQSMAGRLVYAAIIPVAGWITDAYSLVQALTALGLATLIVGSALYLMLRRLEVI
jgi:MFS family permease